MRIRTIKPDFFLHADLFDAEADEKLPLRLAFIGLWCAADREGRFKWEPRRLKAQVMPYDSCDFSRVLHALATRGFLVHYASNGQEFGAIPSFSRHQVINNREADSVLPQYDDTCTLLTRAPRVPHAWGTPLNLDQGEGKGREGKGNTYTGTSAPVFVLEDSKPSDQPSTPARFTPPTASEVSAYSAEIGYPMDGQAWCDSYAQKGWVVGKAKMKDWKAAVRNWKSQQWLPQAPAKSASTPVRIAT